jgi:hypothetical protein
MKEPVATKPAVEEISSIDKTPETYLGYGRLEHFSSPQRIAKGQLTQYTFPTKLAQNDWALQGNWIIKEDRIISNQPNAALELNFCELKLN